jgi:hypothetical protein
MPGASATAASRLEGPSSCRQCRPGTYRDLGLRLGPFQDHPVDVQEAVTSVILRETHILGP